jgi:hypothetical protein
MSAICRILCVSLFLYGLAPDVLADTGGKRKVAPMTESEDRELSQRADETPDLAQFEGGSTLGVVITVLVIIALVALIYFLVIKAHNRTYPAARQ